MAARNSRAPFVVTNPVGLRITFFLPRPKGDYGTGRNAGQVKASAPLHPAKKPDVDKLVRAILDSLTGIVYHDDAQVIQVAAAKRYSPDGQPGAKVTVQYL